MQTRTPLYAHQQRAVDKVARLRVAGLFMEMGTGKTRVAIELACLRQARIDRVVWFCPVSLKETVAEEIRKHTDSAESDLVLFDDRINLRTLSMSAFWYIIGIESMSASNRIVLCANRLITTRSLVIVDESSYIKGHAARRTQRITRLSERAHYRLILTGTPLSQGVVDLFAQMRFLSPKILGYHSFYSFARNHLEYSEKYPGMIVAAHNVGWLAAKVQPYVYQVTKAECLDLPRKLFDVRYVSLSPEQEFAYQQAKYEILQPDSDGEIDSYTIFRLFTALQQIASGYWLRTDPRTGERERLEFPNHRLAYLMAALMDVSAETRVIIWVKYRRSLEAILAALAAEYGAEAVATFHGGLSERERSAQLALFRQQARFLVATMQSGGHGLNLTEANHVIFYENEFKYATRLQAEDRCHRIGQTLPVTYLDLVACCKIEQRIQEALRKKGGTVNDFRRQIDAIKDKRGKELKAAVMEMI